MRYTIQDFDCEIKRYGEDFFAAVADRVRIGLIEQDPSGYLLDDLAIGIKGIYKEIENAIGVEQ